MLTASKSVNCLNACALFELLLNTGACEGWAFRGFSFASAILYCACVCCLVFYQM